MTSGDSSSSCTLHLEARHGEVLAWPEGETRPETEWFDPAALLRQGRADAGRGRGSTYLFEAGGRQLVLRHYRRGGLVRHASDDRYLRTGLRRSRPWRELAILARLAAGGMPVPAPVAARVTVEHTLSPWYRGDLITGYLGGTRTLAEALRARRIDDASWPSIGATLARFHGAGVDHADLNAHNVLLDDDENVYLVDFDRARVRFPGPWRRRNLSRLRRSLDKLQAAEPGLGFTEGAWQRLLGGYRSV